MCGINLVISRAGRAKSRINRMNHALLHRGPDEVGVEKISAYCAIGQTRLKILDLHTSASKQPKKQDGYFLSYNGEIVNYQTLSGEFGYDDVRSDTDFLFRALIEYGPEKVCPKLHGMYAFIFLDTINDKIFIHRDTFGIKPLYYFWNNREFAVSSEVNGVLSAGLFQPSVNIDVASQYFSERHISAPYTLITEVKQLIPGELLEISLSSVQLLNRSVIKLETFNGSSCNLESILKDVLKEWCLSDVPVGVFLSGGLDSSLLTAMSTEFSDIKKAYCASFENGIDETQFAQQIAQEYRLNLEIVSVKERQYLDLTQQLVAQKGLPLSVPNEVAIYMISSRMKDDITVAISGEGADEFFGGYENILNSTFSNWDEFYERYSYVPRTLIEKTGLKFFTNKILEEPVSRAEVYDFFRSSHLQGLLSRVDSMTMLNSIEARPALVDGRILKYIDSTFSLEELSESGNGKKPLKSVALNYMSEELVYRKKVGFPVPLNRYLNSIIERIESIMKDPTFHSKIDLGGIIQNLSDYSNGGQIAWMIWNYLLWEQKLLNHKYKY